MTAAAIAGLANPLKTLSTRNEKWVWRSGIRVSDNDNNYDYDYHNDNNNNKNNNNYCNNKVAAVSSGMGFPPKSY